MATHLIAGLGETEEEMIISLANCLDRGIRVGLFAFTPIRGTVWADKQPPAIDYYRRVQIAYYLLKMGCSRDIFYYQEGKLSGISLPPAEINTLLADGKAFQTSGCRGCNRPYYNERPGGTMYNYPRPLTLIEVRQAITESGLFESTPFAEATIPPDMVEN